MADAASRHNAVVVQGGFKIARELHRGQGPAVVDARNLEPAANGSGIELDEVAHYLTNGPGVTESPNDVPLRLGTQGGLGQFPSTSNQGMTTPPDQVFVSYSHKDERWFNDLQTHLNPYLREGSITAWSDRRIRPGELWLEQIKTALAKTKVAVLLVTPAFLASDFIHKQELGPLLKEAEAGGVTILWIHVRACSYHVSPLKNYQAAFDPTQPLAQMRAKRDSAWVHICKEIANAVNPT